MYKFGQDCDTATRGLVLHEALEKLATDHISTLVIEQALNQKEKRRFKGRNDSVVITETILIDGVKNSTNVIRHSDDEDIAADDNNNNKK